jgi:hypothetical protein
MVFGTAFLSLGLATRTVVADDLRLLAGIPALLESRAALRRPAAK